MRRERRNPIHYNPETGDITIKCDTPDCRIYVPGDCLTEVKVTVMIDDPEGSARKIPVQRLRQCCPHCAALSSRRGTQAHLVGSDKPRFARSAVKATELWKVADRRGAREIDPKSFEELRKGRYGR